MYKKLLISPTVKFKIFKIKNSPTMNIFKIFFCLKYDNNNVITKPSRTPLNEKILLEIILFDKNIR